MVLNLEINIKMSHKTCFRDKGKITAVIAMQKYFKSISLPILILEQ